MEFFDVIRSRQSIRVYRKDRIPADVLMQLLEAVRTAPTAGNLQAYQVYVVENPQEIGRLGSAAYGQECVTGAAVVLVFCTDAARSAAKYTSRGTDLYSIQDTTIAATLAHLSAVALGLGSVLVGAFDEAKVAAVVGAPSGQRPILMLPLGFPNESPKPTDRRPVEDIVVRR
jgi:nitroreductase